MSQKKISGADNFTTFPAGAAVKLIEHEHKIYIKRKLEKRIKELNEVQNNTSSSKKDKEEAESILTQLKISKIEQYVHTSIQSEYVYGQPFKDDHSQIEMVQFNPEFDYSIDLLKEIFKGDTVTIARLNVLDTIENNSKTIDDIITVEENYVKAKVERDAQGVKTILIILGKTLQGLAEGGGS